MSLFAVFLAGSSWAGTADAELLVERAKVAIREERPLEAREFALAAIEEDPKVWAAFRVYLRACDAAGMPERAEADFSDLRTSDPVAAVVWSWWRVNAGDAPLSDLEQVAAEFPDHGKLALAFATRRQDEHADVGALAEGDDSDLAGRLRIRLARSVNDDRLAARHAREWLGAHPTRPDVLTELWPGRSKGDKRAQKWAVKAVDKAIDQYWEDPLYLYRAVRMYAAAKVSDRSKPAAERIRELGLDPPLYRRPWNGSMQRAMGRTLAMAHAPDLPQASGTELLEITKARAAHLLDRGTSNEAVAAWAQLREISDSYEAAVAEAELLADLDRPKLAISSLTEAISLAVAPAIDDAARMDSARQAIELGHALGRRAEIVATLDQANPLDLWLARRLAPHPRWDALPPDDPEATTNDAIAGLQTEPILVWATIATLLEPTSGAHFGLRARAQESAGHLDAAFASFARARTLEAEIGEGLVRTYTGLVDPGPASMAVTARQAEIADSFESRRAELYPEKGLPDPKIIAMAPSTARGNRPRVGRAIPMWSADFDGVTLDPDRLDGQVYVLAMWASWCGPCREELPEISEVIGSLQAEGLAVKGLAVSTDDDRSAYERFRRKEGWDSLQVAHEITLRERFRITSLPTTWVVAADGTVVHQQIGYDPAFAGLLEQILRKHAQ